MKKKFVKKIDSNIIINDYQLKNPFVREFTFEYKTQNGLNCDFKVSDKFNCYFLSLKYHQAFPSYIETRISQNKEKDLLKILFCIYDLQEVINGIDNINLSKNQDLNFNLSLVLDDSDISQNTFKTTHTGTIPIMDSKRSEIIEKILTDLNFICLNLDTLLVICYNGYDLGQYIYSLSQIDKVDNKVTGPVRQIPIEDKLAETVCMIDNINKTDAANLFTNFNNLRSIANANNNILSLIPSFTDRKKKSISDTFNYDFSNFNK